MNATKRESALLRAYRAVVNIQTAPTNADAARLVHRLTERQIDAFNAYFDANENQEPEAVVSQTLDELIAAFEVPLDMTHITVIETLHQRRQRLGRLH